MKRTSLTTHGPNTGPLMLRRGLAALASSLLLAACGGGGSGSTASTTPPVTAVTQPTVQDMSANTSAVPSSTSGALTVSYLSTQALVASASESETYNCAGGGTAVYTEQASTLSDINNHLLNAGDTFAVVYTNCTGLYGNASLNGTFNVDVTNVTTSATSTEVDLATSSNDLVVTVPQGTVTINGASTLDITSTTSGATTTTTTVWQSSGITAVTQFGTRTSTWTLSNVDLTRTVVTTSGTVTSTSESGNATLTVTRATGTWSVTVSSSGGVQYDVNGVPVSGSWTVVFPHNTLYITVANGMVTVGVDWGNDGTINATYTFGSSDLAATAG